MEWKVCAHPLEMKARVGTAVKVSYATLRIVVVTLVLGFACVLQPLTLVEVPLPTTVSPADASA